MERLLDLQLYQMEVIKCPLRKEQKENGMLKGTERGKFIFCFKEAENEKGADAPVEGERKSKTKKTLRQPGIERMGTVHFTIKPLARED